MKFQDFVGCKVHCINLGCNKIIAVSSPLFLVLRETCSAGIEVRQSGHHGKKHPCYDWCLQLSCGTLSYHCRKNETPYPLFVCDDLEICLASHHHHHLSWLKKQHPNMSFLSYGILQSSPPPPPKKKEEMALIPMAPMRTRFVNILFNSQIRAKWPMH